MRCAGDRAHVSRAGVRGVASAARGSSSGRFARRAQPPPTSRIGDGSHRQEKWRPSCDRYRLNLAIPRSLLILMAAGGWLVARLRHHHGRLAAL